MSSYGLGLGLGLVGMVVFTSILYLVRYSC